jgi:Phytanoyl-CoA dioxygenase (PhyH)
MIFRRKQAQSTAVADPQSPEEMFAEIGELTRANRERRDPEIERRILLLRHRAGAGLADPGAQPPPLPEADFDALPEADGPGLPVVRTDQLSPGLLRAGILRHGCLLIRGVIEPDDAAEMAAEVERSFQARDAFLAGDGAGEDGYYEEFEPEAQYDLSAERSWVTGGGGIWGADSPRLMYDVLEKLERAGLQRLISDYLGERPAISVNKCTLRKVDPDTGVGWHQDGAFLGDGVRAMNVWIALTRCGDVAPGMDIVPRRLEEIVETGTRGATFDWSVGPEVAEEAAGEAGVLRPIFEAGDVLLFDDMFLHTTATDPSMTKTRYAIESWFFGPSGFPREYVPLAF